MPSRNPTTRSPRRARARGLRLLGWMLSALALLGVAAVLALSLFLRHAVEAALEAGGVPATIESARLDPASLRLRLAGVRLGDPARPAVVFEDVALRLDLRGLPAREVRVRHLELAGMQLDVAALGAARWRWEPPPELAGWRLVLDEVALEDLRLPALEARLGRPVTIRQARLEDLRETPEGREATVAVELALGEGRLGVDARAMLAADTLRLEGTWRAEAVPLDAWPSDHGIRAEGGRLDGFGDLEAVYDARLGRLDVRSLGRLTGRDLRAVHTAGSLEDAGVRWEGALTAAWLPVAGLESLRADGRAWLVGGRVLAHPGGRDAPAFALSGDALEWGGELDWSGELRGSGNLSARSLRLALGADPAPRLEALELVGEARLDADGLVVSRVAAASARIRTDIAVAELALPILEGLRWRPGGGLDAAQLRASVVEYPIEPGWRVDEPVLRGLHQAADTGWRVAEAQAVAIHRGTGSRAVRLRAPAAVGVHLDPGGSLRTERFEVADLRWPDREAEVWTTEARGEGLVLAPDGGWSARRVAIGHGYRVAFATTDWEVRGLEAGGLEWRPDGTIGVEELILPEGSLGTAELGTVEAEGLRATGLRGGADGLFVEEVAAGMLAGGDSATGRFRGEVVEARGVLRRADGRLSAGQGAAGRIVRRGGREGGSWQAGGLGARDLVREPDGALSAGILEGDSVEGGEGRGQWWARGFLLDAPARGAEGGFGALRLAVQEAGYAREREGGAVELADLRLAAPRRAASGDLAAAELHLGHGQLRRGGMRGDLVSLVTGPLSVERGSVAGRTVSAALLRREEAAGWQELREVEVPEFSWSDEGGLVLAQGRARSLLGRVAGHRYETAALSLGGLHAPAQGGLHLAEGFLAIPRIREEEGTTRLSAGFLAAQGLSFGPDVLGIARLAARRPRLVRGEPERDLGADRLEITGIRLDPLRLSLGLLSVGGLAGDLDLGPEGRWEVPAVPGTGAWPPLRVAALRVAGSRLTLRDGRPTPPLAVVIEDPRVDLWRFDAARPRPVPLRISGRLPGLGGMTGEGQVLPLASGLEAEVRLGLEIAELAGLAGFLGRAFRLDPMSGQGGIDLDLAISDRRLVGLLELSLSGVELRPLADPPAPDQPAPVPVDPASPPPPGPRALSAALALLEDPAGDLNLRVRLAAALDDPRLDLPAALAAAVHRAMDETLLHPLGLRTGPVPALDVTDALRFAPLEFARGEAGIGLLAEERLLETAAWLHGGPRARLVVCALSTEGEEGPPWPGGAPMTPLDLAAARDHAVRAYLLEIGGLAASRLLACPPGLDPDPEGRPRVELVVQGAEPG